MAKRAKIKLQAAVNGLAALESLIPVGNPNTKKEKDAVRDFDRIAVCVVAALMLIKPDKADPCYCFPFLRTASFPPREVCGALLRGGTSL